MMNTGLNQGSAKIYQFPVGRPVGTRRTPLGETKADLATAPRVNEAVCSGSWYHEAAIQESKTGA